MIHQGHIQFVTTEKKVVTFYHCPKTGGTSLRKHILETDDFLIKQFINYGTHKPIELKDFHLKSDFTWTHIRNPWEIYSSFYQMERQIHKTFLSFHDWFFRQCPDICMEHYCNNSDFVVRFENMLTDLTVVFNKIGMPFNPTNYPHVWSYNLSDYQNFYDTKLIDTVYERHKDLIKRFDYSF